MLQRSDHGTLQFLIFTNDAFRTKKVDVSLFTDDELLFTSSFKVRTMPLRLKQACHANKQSFTTGKIKLTVSKIEAILFTKRRPTVLSNIFCGDVEIY